MHFTIQIKASLVSHAQDGGDRLHVLVEDRAALGGVGGSLCGPGGVGGLVEDGNIRSLTPLYADLRLISLIIDLIN